MLKGLFKTRQPSSGVNEMRPLRSLYGPNSAGTVITAAAVMFGILFALRAAHDQPASGIGLFYVLPVTLLALRFGLRGGLVAAFVASLLYTGWSLVDYDGLPASAFVSRTLVFFAVGATVGYLSSAIVSTLTRFDVALRAAPILVFSTDTDLRYTWTHHTWSGRIDVPMIGLTDAEILGAEAGGRAMELKRRALETEESQHDVYDIVDPDGVKRWFSVTVEPIRESGGRVVGLTGAALDVTPELSAAEALEHSEARFRSAAENQLEPFALYAPLRDERGKIVDFICEFINEPGAASVGMRPDDMVGERLRELFPGRLESGLLDEYSAVVETGEPVFREAVDFINVLGEETLVRGFDIRVSKLDGGIQITWRDITDKLRAERERDWITAIVEHSADAIMSVDLNGRLVSWSAGAERIYGYAADEVIGKPFTILVPESELQERRARIDRIFSGEIVGPVTSTEYRKDGSAFEAEYTGAPILDAEGAVIGGARIVREHREGDSPAAGAAETPAGDATF